MSEYCTISKERLAQLHAAEETLAKLRNIFAGVSEGPYEWGIIKESPEQIDLILGHFKNGSGDAHLIFLPKHPDTNLGEDPLRPEHVTVLCMTGNGPNSQRNALCIMDILKTLAS